MEGEDIGSSSFIEGEKKRHLHTLRNQQKFSLKVTEKPLALKFNNYYFVI